MNRRYLLKVGILGACAGGGGHRAPVTIGLVSTGMEGPRLAVQIQQIIQDMHSQGKATALTHTLLSPRA
jgi:hypothetical protein